MVFQDSRLSLPRRRGWLMNGHIPETRQSRRLSSPEKNAEAKNVADGVEEYRTTKSLYTWPFAGRALRHRERKNVTQRTVPRPANLGVLRSDPTCLQLNFVHRSQHHLSPRRLRTQSAPNPALKLIDSLLLTTTTHPTVSRHSNFSPNRIHLTIPNRHRKNEAHGSIPPPPARRQRVSIRRRHQGRSQRRWC